MTQTETPASDTGHGQATGGDDFHDPEHDVDGLKTGIAVFGTLILIVGTIWVMSQLFSVMVHVERKAKIHDLEPKELVKIQAMAEDELAGKNANRGSMTIEKAMQALSTK